MKSGQIDYGFITVAVILVVIMYLWIVIGQKQIVNTVKNGISGVSSEEQNRINLNKSKYEPVFVFLKTIPESNDYVFKHDRLMKRKSPEHRMYPGSNKELFLGFNNILRYFFLTEHRQKIEVLKMNYIPDDFDFTRQTSRLFSDLNDVNTIKDFLPSTLAKTSDEIDDLLEAETRDTGTGPGNGPNITFKKNKITLQTLDEHYLNIKYSIFPKPEYDIAAVNKNIVESVLKLRQCYLPAKNSVKGKKGKKVYYIKFPNDYYLCVNKEGLLYASGEKNRIFYFDLVTVTKEQLESLYKVKETETEI